MVGVSRGANKDALRQKQELFTVVKLLRSFCVGSNDTSRLPQILILAAISMVLRVFPKVLQGVDWQL